MEKRRPRSRVPWESLVAPEVMNDLGEAVYVRDRNGTIVYLNPAAETLTGWTRGQAVGKACYEVFADLERRCVESCKVDSVLENGVPVTDQMGAFRSKDGKVQQVLVSAFPVRHRGKVVGVMVKMSHLEASDATTTGLHRTLHKLRLEVERRRKAEEDLKASEERYRYLIERAPDGIALVKDGRIHYANPALCRMLGLEEERILGRHMGELIHPTERERVMDYHRRRMAGEDVPSAYETTLVLRDGRTLNVEVNVGLIEYQGEPAALAFVRDLTGVHSSKRDLALTQARLAALMTHLPNVALYETGGGREYISENISNLLGYPPEAFTRDRNFFVSLIHPEDLPKNEAALAEWDRLSRKEPLTLRFRVKHRDGHWMWVEDRMVQVYPEAGAPYMAGVMVDVTEAQRIQQQLEESERRYRQFFDEDLAGNYITKPDGTFLLCNRSFARIFGFESVEQALGTPVRLFYPHPEARERFLQLLKAKRRLENHEDVMVRRDGRLINVLENAVGIFDERGELVQIHGYIIDITAQKQALDDLRKSEEKLRNIVEHSTNLFYAHDTNHVLTYVSPQSREILGCEPEEALVRWTEFITDHPINRRGYELTQRAIDTGQRQPTYELELLAKNGRKVWVEVREAPMVVEGKTVAIVGALTDITERKRAEEALQRERDFVFSLLQASPTFFVAIEPKGGVMMMNEAMLKALGYTLEEVVGVEYLQTFVPERERKAVADVFVTLTTSHQSTINENHVLTKDGREVLVEWHGSQVLDASGQVAYFFGVGIDITERRRGEEERHRLEEHLRHVQKLESLGVLAGGIAHDFNNLLVAILGNAELALMDLPPESPARPSVEAIRKASMRASDLTNQMLAYSGKGRFVVEPINLNRLIEEITHLLEVTRSKTAVIKYDLAPNLPPVMADATQIRQVLMNLVTNASEAVGTRSGVISISTGVMVADRSYLSETYLDDNLEPGRYVFLEVSDTGVGMDAETIKRIFDPFFTTKFTGRGLGLAAVLGIVRGHRGAIKVYSEPGRGSTFKVLLPALENAVARNRPSAAPSESFDWKGSGTVLVADDEEGVRTVARAILERKGFDVLTAADGEEAIELFRANADRIVLVLLDMTMPKAGGEETFRVLRQIRRDIKVILTSGYNEQDATNRFAGKGLAGFIQKPFKVSVLLEKIHTVLKGGRALSGDASDPGDAGP